MSTEQTGAVSTNTMLNTFQSMLQLQQVAHKQNCKLFYANAAEVPGLKPRSISTGETELRLRTTRWNRRSGSPETHHRPVSSKL